MSSNEKSPYKHQKSNINTPQQFELSASEISASNLIYGLYDKPPLKETIIAALQHFLTSFIGIVSFYPILGSALGLASETIAYLISMSLIVSGFSTFIQAKTIGPIGSGLLSIQGSSVVFLGPSIAIGTAAIANGLTPEEALATLLGLSFFASFVEIFLSQLIQTIASVITPLVMGTVITMLGLTLVKVAIMAIGGGQEAIQNGTFGAYQNLLLAGLVLLTIIGFNCSQKPWFRMLSVSIGLAVGYFVALIMGRVDLSIVGQVSAFTLPQPFKFGFGFDPEAFITFSFLFVITTIETIGDLSVTMAVTNEPIRGEKYIRRLKGGILGDGFNSLLAACFNTLPNTTYSGNNGIIQITGVASRYVGYFIAALFVLAGLFPIVGAVVQTIPQSVLGGAILILFGSVAVAGIRILSTIEFTQRSLIILATSFGLGFGVVYMPEILDQLPTFLQDILSSGINTAGLSALLLDAILPDT